MSRKHIFDVDVAQKYGINVAIILENLGFWISKNMANEKHFYDGRTWTYNSVKAFQELFPYLSAKQIRSTLDKMVELGLIIKGNYNKSAYDRTCWYALTDLGISICLEGQINITERANQIDNKGEPIPDINSDNKKSNINTDNIYMPSSSKKENEEKEPKKEKEVKHRYGEYQHTLLTDKQVEKLNDEYGKEITEQCITYLDEYIEMKGYKAKNHYLCIRKWVIDAVTKQNNQNSYRRNNSSEQSYGLENTAENDISAWWGK